MPNLEGTVDDGNKIIKYLYMFICSLAIGTQLATNHYFPKHGCHHFFCQRFHFGFFGSAAFQSLLGTFVLTAYHWRITSFVPGGKCLATNLRMTSNISLLFETCIFVRLEGWRDLPRCFFYFAILSFPSSLGSKKNQIVPVLLSYTPFNSRKKRSIYL